MASAGSDVADGFGLLLRRSTRTHLYGHLTASVADGLDESTYPVLSGLARFGPLSAAQLGEEIGIDRSVASRHASRLEDAGLLRRDPDAADRRAVLLSLTPAGRRAVDETRRRLASTFDAYLATWPADQARSFAASFRRFAEQGPFHPGSEPKGIGPSTPVDPTPGVR